MSSDNDVRDYVESADFVLMLGTFITDMNMGIYTAKIDPDKSALATTEAIKIGYHRYDDVQFAEYLQRLEAACRKERRKAFAHPHPPANYRPLAKSELQ